MVIVVTRPVIYITREDTATCFSFNLNHRTQ